MQPQTGHPPIEIAFSEFKNQECQNVIDCRSCEEFECNHLTDAINIPLQHLSVKQETFPFSKEEPFYVYCRTGNRSATFVTYLRSLGYDHCQSIAGGFEAWENEAAC